MVGQLHGFSTMTKCMQTLDKVFHEYVASSFDKQLYLSELLGEHTWNFNLERGILSFDKRYHFASQILGTESKTNQTWCWAWANKQSHIPEKLLQMSKEVYLWGKRNGVTEFVEGTMPIGAVNGHYLSLIASGLCEADCYYQGPYEDGSLFLLVKDSGFPKKEDRDVASRISAVFPQVISQFELNHKAAYIAYLKYYGLRHTLTESPILTETLEGKTITAEFDGQDRLKELIVR